LRDDPGVAAEEEEMPPIASSIEIARRPEDVFAYVTDPARLAEWQESVVSSRMEGTGRPGAGTRASVTRRIGRVEREMTSELAELDPPTPGPFEASMDRSGGMSRGPSRLSTTVRGRA
jgi:uncharacterized protein YndB with AHSA1/START domain